jgi:DNA topoisomerase-1
VLQEFWVPFKETVKASEQLKIQDVLGKLEEDLAFHLFPHGERQCPQCPEGRLNLRLGKFGAFLGCSHYPTCTYVRSLDASSGEETASEGPQGGALSSSFPRVLGLDPQRNEELSVRLGPYGPYLQWGEGKKPKRVSLPKGQDIDALTLEQALRLGQLPRDLGLHPETGLPLTGGLGRFGPYIKHGDRFVSTKDLSLVLEGSLDQVVAFLHEKAQKPSGRPPSATRKTRPASKKPTLSKKPKPSQKA